MKKRVLSIFLAAMIMITAVAFSACDEGQNTNNEMGTHTVTFDLNYENAENPWNVQSVENKGVVKEPAVPTREDYEFVAWHTGKNEASSKVDFERSISSDTTYYAIWKKTVATVILDYNYDGAMREYKKVAIGSSMQQFSDPKREGFLFTAWYTDNDTVEGSEYDFGNIVKNDFTLYAGWEEITVITTHTVTISLGYEGAVNPASIEVNDGDKLTRVQLPDPVRDGYVFVDWYVDSDLSNLFGFNTAITDDITLYAKWNEAGSEIGDKDCVVTLDFNYEGASNPSPVTVKEGSYLTRTQLPVPEREGYIFADWYTDASSENRFSFSTVISGDITLYAKWEKEEGPTVNPDGTITVKFNYNYSEAPSGGEYYSKTVAKGRVVAKPAVPVRDGYYFNGWYLDSKCTNAVTLPMKPDKNMTLYAYWIRVHTFEAELTDLSDIQGAGYSGPFGGTDIIMKDNENLGASGGYYISYLYVKGVEVVFEVDVADDVENAIIALSLAGEQIDFTLTDQMYKVQVNGQDLSYNNLSFKLDSSTKTPFATYIISTTVSLKKGKNVIKLVTDNSVGMVGTMYATAPMVDCLYIYANVDIEWANGFPKNDNLEGK